ncbi:phage holin family protein [Bacteroidales bacterium OttesenSCG-928-B11]|nr:phage holin family protein [Bacteroidales bacterium OttesenSCG-928-B11]MDL2326248.1 phage holin family protein [Bacteroidales bacterium OttesenSCG-928-A14]
MDNQKSNPPADQSLLDNVKEYLSLQIDLLKINAVEKTSGFLSMLIGFIVGTLLVLVATIFLSFALINWLGTFFATMIPAYLIMAGIFILLFFIFYFVKDKLVQNILVKKISRILFEKEQKDDDE